MADKAPTEAELVATRKVLGELALVFAVLAVPYLIIGVFWADAHSEHLTLLHGPDRLFSYFGEVLAWPVLIFSDITLK